jgi:hypothetical protein
VNDFLVGTRIPSKSVSWRIPTRMTGCTAPWLPSQGDRGSCTTITVGAGHSALERWLEMVSSACGGRYCPERCFCATDRRLSFGRSAWWKCGACSSRQSRDRTYLRLARRGVGVAVNRGTMETAGNNKARNRGRGPRREAPRRTSSCCSQPVSCCRDLLL